MGVKSLFRRGKEGREKAEQIQKETKSRWENRMPWQFKTEVGKRKRGTFLDDVDFYLSLHDVKLPGDDFFTPVTCLQDLDTCPICFSGKSPSYALISTIIDNSKYTFTSGKNSGKVTQHQKRLAVFKGTALQNIQWRKDDLKESLKNHCFWFGRSKDKECKTGSDIVHFKKFTPEQMKAIIDPEVKEKGDKAIEEYYKPYNYEKLFAPKSVEELSACVGGQAPIGSSSSHEGQDSDEDVEFHDPVDATKSNKVESVSDLFDS